MRIKQVLLNVQENALKHTPRKGSIFILCQYVSSTHNPKVDRYDVGAKAGAYSPKLDLTNKYVNLQ